MKRFGLQKASLFLMLLLGVFTLGGCGDAGNGHWDKPLATMTALAVTPATASIPVDGYQQFTAIATYDDGTTLDVTNSSVWTSATPAVATVETSTGFATGVTSGNSVVSAAYNGQTATATLTVNAATLTSLLVTPALASIPVDGTRQFMATAVYSDGSTLNVTNAPTIVWTAVNVPAGGPAVATLSTTTKGFATGIVNGTSAITATFGGQSDTSTLTVNEATLVSLAVTPAVASIPVDGTQLFTATATYSDGSIVDVTEDSTTVWSAVNSPVGGPAVATLSPNGLLGAGLATGVISGVSEITATFGGQSDTANLTVNAATLTSLAVTPALASIPVDGTQLFTATATYSDGSIIDVTEDSTTVWTAVNSPVGGPAVATLSPNGLVGAGLATGKVEGTSVITATFGTESDTATLTVTAATLTSFSVTPALASILVDETQLFTATATYSDGSIIDVTEDSTTVWTAVNSPVGGPAVATLSPNGLVGAGLATGKVEGTSVITATFGTESDTATLTVTAPLVVTIIPGDVCPVATSLTIPTATMSDPTDGLQFVTTSTSGVVGGGKEITATFSLAMDPLTIESALPGDLNTFTIKETVSGNNVAGTVAMDLTNTIATFTTSAALTPDLSYTVSITTDAMTIGPPATAIACPYEWTFKTTTPAAIGQLPVPLGSASNFVILASAAITNIPTSAITGDVGLTPDTGSNISGFTDPLTCPEVTGTIYAVDAAGPACALIDPVLIQNAKNDAEAAFLNARAAVRGTPTSISGDLNGLTFYPGLYESLTSLEISPGGSLYLDGQGDVNAVFIIRSETSITTESTSQVILTGGTKANNVYWTAGSSVTLGTNSIMKGTMIAGTKIELLTGANLEGRALNQGAAAEAITLDQATLTLPLP